MILEKGAHIEGLDENERKRLEGCHRVNSSFCKLASFYAFGMSLVLSIVLGFSLKDKNFGFSLVLLIFLLLTVGFGVVSWRKHKVFCNAVEDLQKNE